DIEKAMAGAGHRAGVLGARPIESAALDDQGRAQTRSARPLAGRDPEAVQAGVRRSDRAMVARRVASARRRRAACRTAPRDRSLPTGGRERPRVRARAWHGTGPLVAVGASHVRAEARAVPARPEPGVIAMDLSVVIPVLNEAQNLPILWDELSA